MTNKIEAPTTYPTPWTERKEPVGPGLYDANGEIALRLHLTQTKRERGAVAIILKAVNGKKT